MTRQSTAEVRKLLAAPGRAIAGLALLACLLSVLLLPMASAHAGAGDQAASAIEGHPGSLQDLVFGAATPRCPPIEAGLLSGLDQGGVLTSVITSVESRGIRLAAVPRWHLEASPLRDANGSLPLGDNLADPAALNGLASGWVALGPDGYLLGTFADPVTDQPGDDLVLRGVGVPLYCIYGAPAIGGPFLFIGSADGFDGAELAFDLEHRYTPASRLDNIATNDGVLQAVLIVASGQHFPLFTASFAAVAGPEPADDPIEWTFRPQVVRLGHEERLDILDVATDPVESVRWTFGDRETLVTAPDDVVQHAFAGSGAHAVCMIATTVQGLVAQSCHDVLVPDRAPRPDFDVQADGHTLRFADRSHDPDGDAIQAWGWDFGDGAYAAGPNPTHRFNDAGRHAVTLRVQDEHGTVGQATLVVQVRDEGAVNRPPELTPQGEPQLLAGQPLEVRVTARDPDGDALRIAADGLPSWLRFDAATGSLQGTPPGPGVFDGITVAASDGEFVVSRPLAVSVYADDTARGASDATPDADLDSDGLADDIDLCPSIPDTGADLDGDSIGDACDLDVDGDGVPQVATLPGLWTDNCPTISNSLQDDSDADGVGDACPVAVVVSREHIATPDTQLAAPKAGEDPFWGPRAVALTAGIAVMLLCSLGLTLWTLSRWKS